MILPTMPQETPIIIGVSDIKNYHSSNSLETAKEPLDLIHEAILGALLDACAPSGPSSLQSQIDGIDVVRTWTWPYPDLPGSLAEKLGVKEKVKWKAYSEHGGDKPGVLLDEAARKLAKGEGKVAVVCGGEALASLTAYAKSGKIPPPGWTEPAEAIESVFSPTTRTLGEKNLGAIHKVGAPIHVYPMYENAFRAHRGQTLKENHEESAELYAEFSKIASENEYAWNYGKYDDAKAIGTIGKNNRMICSPYPLLMNAFNTVNLASALILTTTTHARALNIDPSKWIYPLGGAGTSEAATFWTRPNFHTSSALTRSLDSALQISNTSMQQIDLLDIYSCFPIVPKLAADHLGLPVVRGSKPLTLLGGLTSFGGAGNNYSMHALTAMTRALRSGKGKKGLVLCNGGMLTYQFAIVLGTEPRSDGGGYTEKNPLEGVVCEELREGVAEGAEASGEVIVETYTVEFHRSGAPLRGHIVARLKSNGKRVVANHAGEQTLRLLASGNSEVVGKAGWVTQDGERGLFTFGDIAAL
ncbi:hypothetical protein DM02DRAFT_566811 [Periconia macrospinosa]|uniref:Thiolase-like protein type 1 additional C-terminal domain-containing protein n=1 Tax=Periconia macrospinosa TaxID=97972 RepID=A0A2V1DJ05_9PLEO|nr:hypothetical protein DM02DRAFT_566811 [Periconia macrospinosa]